jgi:hypothetical protein
LRLVIVHQIEGRTRLRLRERPEDEAQVPAFVERLAALGGIELVDYRPATGSLIVEHPELDVPGLATAVAQAGGIIEPAGGPPPRPNSLMPVRVGLDQVDGLLNRMTAGGVDMRTLAFTVLVGLAVRQLLRGELMPPAMTLLSWATDLLPPSARAASTTADAADE